MTWFQRYYINYIFKSVTSFDFKFDSLVDENGTNLAKMVVWKDLEEIYKIIEKNNDIDYLVKSNENTNHFKSFLKKKISESLYIIF